MDSQLCDGICLPLSDGFYAPNSPVRESSPSLPATSTSTSVASKRRLRTSKVWDYADFPRNNVVLNKVGKIIWRCKFCKQEYVERGGTSVMATHLRIHHQIDLETRQAARKAGIQADIITAFQQVSQASDHKRRRLDNVYSVQSIDPAMLQHLYVQWVTSCGISFRMATTKEFRA